MYYIEKWENGLLYYKTLPNGNWMLKRPTLADLAYGVEYEKISLHLALDLAYSLGVDAQIKWTQQ